LKREYTPTSEGTGL